MAYVLTILLCSAGPPACQPLKSSYPTMSECLDAAAFSQHTVPAAHAAMAVEISCRKEKDGVS